MNEQFNEWWNEDLLTEDNPFVDNTAAYWAWEGWCAAVKAEREGCAKVCESTAWTSSIEEWRDMTKKDVASKSMLACAAAIRARSCPPCNEDCDQGRNCPARKNT